MRATSRVIFLSILTLAVLAVALPVSAAESGGGTTAETGSTTTTQAEFQYLPAVTVPPAAPAPPDRPWTTKFLIPTGVAIGAIAVFATAVQYFLRVVRTRYKVVE